MKKLLVKLSIFAFLVSCNGNKPTLVDQTETITDADVSAMYSEATGSAVPSNNIVKYESVAGKGASSILSTLTTALPDCIQPPTTLSELNSGGKIFIYKFDASKSAEAKLMGYSGSIGKKEMVFIEDFTSYQLVDCGGEQKKVGIGLRCFIHVVAKKRKLGFSKLSAIAANVELNNAEASFSLEWLGFGIDGSILEPGLPTDGDYDVENFGKLSILFHNVLKTLNSKDNTIKINPVILPDGANPINS